MESGESGNTKATICKTISCLLPSDLEVKRACQLTEFLLEPTVDSYYAVETLYNEPDQKFEEENLPVPNSLRCELLLVFKQQWPFDPEFWDWKTLKRHCLALMGEEASIVSSIDELNDSENPEGLEDDDMGKGQELKDQMECFWDTTNELNEMTDERKKKREIKKLREKGFISARFRNWQAYMQYCVLCDKEFLGHRIVRHAQTHVKDGVYSCPICAESFDDKDVLVPHVASHVKQSCKERLAAMKTSRKLANASKMAAANATMQKDRLLESQLCKPKLDHVNSSHSNNADASVSDKDELSAAKAEHVEEYSCPVANCRKGFKYFRNLMAHVKAHDNNDEAKRFLEMQSKKVVCQYCRRQFVSVTHLNDHLQVHCGVRPYICIQLNCKASFLSNAELLVHRKEHAVFKAKCMFPNCGRVFHEAYMLYDHEAQHYKTFTCKEPGCSKIFHSQPQLDLHQEDHVVKEEHIATQDQTLAELAGPPLLSVKQEPNYSLFEQEAELSISDEVPIEQKPFPQYQAGQSTLSTPVDNLCPTGPVKVKHSVESMLNTELGIPPVPGSDCEESFQNDPSALAQPQFSSTCPDTFSISSPAALCLSEPNQPRVADSAVLPLHTDPGQMTTPALLPVPYQGVLQESNAPSRLDILQSTAQSFPCHSQGSLQKDMNDVRDESKAVCTGSISAPHAGLFVNNNLPTAQSPHCVPAGMPGVHTSAGSQAGPPPAAPLTGYGGGTTSTVAPSTCLGNPAAPEGAAPPKERHNCAFESCTRNYSSYRSVTKHMKAAHPEFYAEWKLAKKNNRIPKTVIHSVSVGGNLNSVTSSQDRRLSSVPVSVVQMQNTISQSLPYSVGRPDPADSNTSIPLSEAGTSLTLPNQMENILNPILLSQLGNSQNQSGSVPPHVGPSSPWPSQSGNNPDISQPVVCPSHMLSSHIHGLPNPPYTSQMNTSNVGPQPTEMGQPALQAVRTVTAHPFLQSQVESSAALPGPTPGEGLHTPCVSSFAPNITQGTPAQMGTAQIQNRGFGHTSQIVPSNSKGMTNPMLTSAMESLPHSVMPSYMGDIKDAVISEPVENSGPLYPPQIQNTAFSNFKPLEGIANAQMKNHANSDFAPEGNSMLRAPTDLGPAGNSNASPSNGEGLAVKRTKRNKRAKWPAIVKDGKFICCRCFREFSSPKSLGGHLSKRSHCKAFDDTDLSTDLPTSFLDLLNSPHVLNAAQQPVASNFNPTMNFKDQTNQPPDRCSLDSRFFPNVTFPQANGSAYSSSDGQNGDVLKQVIDNPTIQDLFESSGIPRTFQSPCVSYTPDGRLPESTVIQHTGNIPVKTKTEPHGEDFIKQEADCRFGGHDFSDPVLSEMLAENNSAVSLSSLPTDHLNQILRAETLMKMRENKGNEDSQQEGISNDGLLAAMASLAQNLMTNPLLQITSSDSSEHTLTPVSPQDDVEKKQSEQNVKKKLREQILSGDLLRRGSLSRPSGADINASPRNLSLQNPLPQTLDDQHSSESSKVVQVMSNGNLRSEMNSIGMVTEAPSKNFGALSKLSARQQGRTPLVPPEAPAVAASVINDTDTDPLLSEVVDETVMELQRALEKLDLDKEVSENTQATKICSPVMNSSLNSMVVNNTDSVKPNITVALDECLKPFVCENEGCKYRAMTKDALFKHLSKTHNYTGEMINEIKKNHGKFAPFRCQMCNKTFTRNSNLRAHCQTVHSLSQDEMIRLRIKRQCNKKPEMRISNDQVSGEKNSLLFTAEGHGKLNESFIKQHMPAGAGQNRTDAILTQNTIDAQKRASQEHHPKSFEVKPAGSLATPESHQDNGLPIGLPIQPAQGIPVCNQTEVEKASPATVMTRHPSEGYLATVDSVVAPQPPNALYPSVPTSHAKQQGESPAQILPAGASSAPAASGPPQGDPLQLAIQSPDKGFNAMKPKLVKPKVETPKKIKERKERKPAVKNGEVDDTFSPYRPYRCVHQGCMAAFTIQHNLILHYKAVHQSALPKFEVSNDEEHDDPPEDDKEDSEVAQVSEFRCQVKDCSRIFQEVTSLLQHYLQLHKFTLDKAGGLISNINLGRFQCDQPECSTFFTAFWKYIAHIEEAHKETKLPKVEAVEGLFRCEVEGCDRGYATRSNLLRHTMKKHQDLYKLQLMTQRKNQDRERHVSKKCQPGVDQANDGKENMQNNQKAIQKGNDKKKADDVKNNHWTKYGKPSLKSKEEATAMCTKKFPLQYPCMIKGCESVVSSERNILRHYIRHGLSERYLEEQRSYFIFCKKSSRSKCWSHRSRAKFEDSSTETSENEDAEETGPDMSETESSKPPSGRDETAEDTEMSDAKQSTDDSSETKSVTSSEVKRKRGRPRKSVTDEITPLTRRKALERLRGTRSNPVNYAGNGSDSTSSSSTVPTNEEQPDQSISLSSFKPMGFEVSFLKFLEESTQSAHPPKRKASEVIGTIPLKRDRTIQLKTATVVCKRSDAYVRPRAVQSCIDFRNPQNLTSLRNVKIVVDSAFSHVADLLLKQLQEMRPLVILQK